MIKNDMTNCVILLFVPFVLADATSPRYNEEDNRICSDTGTIVYNSNVVPL